MYIYVVLAFLAISNLFFIRKLRKEMTLRKEAQFRYEFVTRRAEDVFTWCSSEFPQMGSAVLHILAYDINDSWLKHHKDDRCSGSIDQFREFMRGQYKIDEVKGREGSE